MEEVWVKNPNMRNISPPDHRKKENKVLKSVSDKADGGWWGYFSSSNRGTGVNMPQTHITYRKYAEDALKQNSTGISVQAVEVPNF